MADPKSRDVFQLLAAESSCEMGVHSHPWNTPPLDDEESGGVSMMNRLSDEVNVRKLSVLTDLHQKLSQHRPRSSRAGRWGFGPSVANPLLRLGYVTGLSVSPFVDWTSIGGPDYSFASQRPYRFDPKCPLRLSCPGPPPS